MPYITPGEEEFYKKYVDEMLAPLVGATVIATGGVMDTYERQCWPVIRLRTPDGRILQMEISQDEEGNGPGHPFIDYVDS